jgi:hypothetical protein
MTLEKLKENILNWEVPKYLYSINEGLKPNAYIIFENYTKWDYFFLDEKGERIGHRTFNNREDAFDYLWKKLFSEMQYPPSNPPNSVYS